MKKLLLLLFFQIVILFKLSAQVTPPTVQACALTQKFCLTENTFNLCVKIEVTPGLPSPIDHFEIDWGDDSMITTVEGSNTPENQFHPYDFSDFYLTCDYEEKYFVVLETFLENGDVLNSSFQVTFQNPPQAFFDISPPVICVGDEACFKDNSCPTENLEIIGWNYGDGSPEGIGNCHIYDQVGTYNITLTVANNCDTAMTTQQLQVINPPEANITVLSNNIDTSNTPFIYCLGSGLVDLDGDSLSLYETFYEWQSLNNVPGASWILPPDNPNQNDATPNIPDLAVSFSDTGLYHLILEVDNACNQADFDTIWIQVLSGEALAQPNQADGCIELIYTPDNYNPNASYTINGMEQSIFPTTLGIGNYEVICSLTNECGSQTTVDNFEVFDVVDITILSPFPDTSVCLNSDSILILYEPFGGTWTGEHLMTYGDSVFFYPVEVGIFNLNYELSAGVGTDCDDAQAINITVIDSGIEVFDHEVCSSSPPFPMGATPSGGTYTAIDCPSCIQNDTFIISEMLSLQLDAVVVDYNVTSSGGCEGNNSFTIEIDDPNATFELDENYCIGDLISPNISNTNGTLSWMIDGQSVTAPPFNTATLGAGNHTITLTAIAGDCEAIEIQTINIFSVPSDVSFTATPLEGCAVLEVNLNNTTASFDNETYEWYLNDSLFSTLAQAGSILLPQGLNDTTYTISLLAGNSCDGASFEQDITVFPRPVPLFGPMKDQYCSGDTVSFANISFGGPMTDWLWDYGNGITSTDSIPLPMIYFTDTIPTSYTVTLTATNNCGTETFTYDLVINPTNVTAFFNIDPIEACTNAEICLTNLSTLGANVLWDFGDGNTSTNPNICHTYSDSGTFIITLKAFGCGFDSIQSPIIVHPSPQAAFNNNTDVCLNEAVVFNNLTIGAGDFLWDFGDGNISTLNNPTHTYTDIGTYTISLLATSIEECQDSTFGTVNIIALPQAAFTIATDSICKGDIISFTNTSTPDPLTCYWDFGDGNFSNECNPNYTYDTTGHLTVSLIISDNNNCYDTTQQLIYIAPIPQANFNITSSSDCAPALISFTNTSTLAESYIWDFGDGNTSTLSNPIHSYTSGGIYMIELTAINGFCTETFIQNITINQAPDANINLPSGQEGCADFEAQFNSEPNGGSFKYTWDFGDDINSFAINPNHTYTTPGVYQVSLIIEDTLNNCQDTAFATINIFEPLEAEGIATDIICNGELTGAIDITVNSGTMPFEYNWSNEAVLQDLTTLAAGDYALSITDANNCNWSNVFTISEPTAINAEVIDRSIVSCYGGDDGGICIEIDGGVPDYTISWQSGDQGECIENVVAGAYEVTITDSNTCAKNFIFHVLENPPIELIDTSGNISCFGANDGFIRLDSIFGGFSDFYNTTLNGPVNYDGGTYFPDLTPGSYTLMIQDLEGCSIESNYVIGEPDSLWVHIPQDSVYIGMGDSIYIETSHNAVDPIFIWSPSAGLNCNDCEIPIAKPLETTTYFLRLSNPNGCIAQDTITIVVNPNRNFYIPNTFTPNKDGKNDFFRIRSRLLSIRQVNVFRIFNRGGDMVFEAKNFRPQDENLEHAWDGTFRGNPLAPDQFTYYAEIEYIDDEKEVVQGTVLLMH